MPLPFAIIQTEDGSPSLEVTYLNGISERMHHFRGALTETLYVYGPAIAWGVDQPLPVRVLSLGLGLAYNELLTIATALGRPDNQIHLVSFELDQQLREAILSWLEDKDSSLASTLDQILALVAQTKNVRPQLLKETGREWQRAKRWEIRAGFPQELRPHEHFQVILYDAFSAKMDQPLWEETFLSDFLSQHSSPSTVFATYASTGALKRALKGHGFQLEAKVGFGGKKESTLAWRGQPAPSSSYLVRNRSQLF